MRQAVFLSSAGGRPRRKPETDMKYFGNETIAAISTSLTPSGIGIVRISGPEAFAVGDRVFRAGAQTPADRRTSAEERTPADGMTSHGAQTLTGAPANTILYGHIYDGEEPVDEVLVTVLRAPHSFTAEDTVEINCHGGPHILKRILELVLRHGARQADPGEFTKRAFLNGRIDLAQAEAVGELIGAKNEMARKASLDKLRGKASEDIRAMRGEILHEMAFIEAAMDDPEHISIDGCSERLAEKTAVWTERLNVLLDEADRGRVAREGVKTVLAGRPNVGKSSILNLLLGEDRAIVTDVAGTTRDTLEEQMVWGGLSLNMIDTAGIRDTADPVEQIGVDRARKALDEADLVLLVADAAAGIGPEDRELEESLSGKRVIALLNKCDLAKTPEVLGGSENGSGREHAAGLENWGRAAEGGPILFSAKDGTGLKELKERVEDMFFAGKLNDSEDAWVANARQRTALAAARTSLGLVAESIRAGVPEDMYTIDLADAYRELGYIIGEEVEDELIDKIFADFCMGK